ncbi:MAG: trypsin-like peptidase domain-containing protein [Gemmataceae bacterium]
MRRWAIGLCLLGLVAAAAPGQKSGSRSKVNGNIYQKALKSVVWIYNAGESTSGSGSLLDVKDRIVITNYHVVGEESEVVALFPIYKDNAPVKEKEAYYAKVRAGTGKAKVLARESKRDLAIIQLEQPVKDNPPLHLAKNGIGPADEIHCIGNSGVSAGLFDYCRGDVRNVARKHFRPEGGHSFEIDTRMIEHTAPTNPGQSGGPVLNNDGEMVGVTQGGSFREGSSPMSIAVDLSVVKEFLKANKYGRILTAPPPGKEVVSKEAKETPTVTSAPATPDPKAEAEKNQQLAAFKLTFAKAAIRDGKKELAKERLDQIIKDYPDTPAATEAKQLLETLK